MAETGHRHVPVDDCGADHRDQPADPATGNQACTRPSREPALLGRDLGKGLQPNRQAAGGQYLVGDEPA
jgi:hypothetical protein